MCSPDFSRCTASKSSNELTVSTACSTKMDSHSDWLSCPSLGYGRGCSEGMSHRGAELRRGMSPKSRASAPEVAPRPLTNRPTSDRRPPASLLQTPFRPNLVPHGNPSARNAARACALRKPSRKRAKNEAHASRSRGPLPNTCRRRIARPRPAGMQASPPTASRGAVQQCSRSAGRPSSREEPRFPEIRCPL